LRDGRALAYCEWAHDRGPVVLALHGTPASRVWWPGQEQTRAAGVRLITVDRPGFGGSDPLPARRVGDWASDVAELTEALGIDRFGVVGWSGGAPYAAAVAAIMPERLSGVCLVSSASLTYAYGSPTPDDADDAHISDLLARLGLAEATIRYTKESRAWAEGLLDDPASLIERGDVAEGDRWLFEKPELYEGLLEGTREAVRQGAIGACSDWVGLLAPWGFALDEIQLAVALWHGGQDSSVGFADFERVAARIPNGVLTVWPDAGHFGIAKHWDAVLRAAVG
jgi:pimeloyl-ACP methyl ester carboxylesterase